MGRGERGEGERGGRKDKKRNARRGANKRTKKRGVKADTANTSGMRLRMLCVGGVENKKKSVIGAFGNGGEGGWGGFLGGERKCFIHDKAKRLALWGFFFFHCLFCKL